MQANFIIKCVYKGSEEYISKDKNSIILHEFLDSLGHSFKIGQSAFIGEVGKPYYLNVHCADYRKEGEYRKFWTITPVSPNDCIEIENEQEEDG